MNPVLAQIYGTGLDKTASDDTVLDLDNISGAQLLAGLESGEIVLDDGQEKVAADDEIDLSQLSGSQLLELMEQVDDGEEVLNKMASDGSAEYWDMAGRIMAHAMNDELNKTAGPDEIDLDEIDGETLMGLLESGEYELVDAMDKEAGARTDAAKAWMKNMGQKAKASGGRGWNSYKSALRGERFRGAKSTKWGDADVQAAAQRQGIDEKGFGKIRRGQMARGAAETAAAYGGTGGTVALAGYGGHKGVKKLRRKK